MMRRIVFRIEDGGSMSLPNAGIHPEGLHGATSQKITIRTHTALKTSNSIVNVESEKIVSFSSL
jgi:hypothetical protein